MNFLSLVYQTEIAVRMAMTPGPNGDEPWWVAKDVFGILGIVWKRGSGNSGSLSVLDDDEKGVANCYTPGGPQEMNIINEPGLYRLCFRSRKPAAKAFTRWITHEVLPTLRATGAYTLPGADSANGAGNTGPASPRLIASGDLLTLDQSAAVSRPAMKWWAEIRAKGGAEIDMPAAMAARGVSRQTLYSYMSELRKAGIARFRARRGTGKVRILTSGSLHQPRENDHASV